MFHNSVPGSNSPPLMSAAHERSVVQHCPFNTRTARIAQSGVHRTVCGVCARIGTYLPSAPRWSAPYCGGLRKRVFKALGFAPWWTERELQEAYLDKCLGNAKRRQPHYLPQCLATRGMISAAPCTMCQRCPCMRCWQKSCVMPPQFHSNSRDWHRAPSLLVATQL